jgi:hypothetical protein
MVKGTKGISKLSYDNNVDIELTTPNLVANLKLVSSCQNL